jgi:short-subunit dehydrogenase
MPTVSQPIFDHWIRTGVIAATTLLAVRPLIRHWREFDFRGKTALVTGGSRGLGLILARELVAQGANVAVCARDAGELERAQSDLCSVRQDARVLPLVCDLTQRQEVELMVRSVQRQFSSIDVLINNAGIILVGPHEEMEIEDYEEAMQVNFFGALYVTLAALPEMRRRRNGRIVNISSIGGKLSIPHLLPYSCSKFALTGLSEGLRAELAKDSIVVTTVCPGLMRTGSSRHAYFKGKHRAEHAWFSISDALPVVSMNAEKAARQILDACRQGKAELVLTLSAQIAVLLHSLLPGSTVDLLGVINRLLPKPGGIGQRRLTGKESTSIVSPSILTTLNERAARNYNQLP